MALLEELAEDLARKALKRAEETGDEKLVDAVAKVIGASSTTLEEQYLTSIRLLRAYDRGLDLVADDTPQIGN